jgi:hypothetical protein
MTTYVIRNGELVEKQYAPPLARDGVQIMSDIQPYRSMIDGHMVTSRSEHRTHLRDHGCIEVGNETMKNRAEPVMDRSASKRMIGEMLADTRDRQLKQMISEARRQAR